MTGTLFVALDILREASKRRWMIAMMVAITLLLLAVALTLRMEVVDGALAATRLFGKSMGTDIVAPEVALRPVFRGATYVVFYGGLAFGILSCADFAPDLFSPGRIEHLLALPLRRWELLGGTFTIAVVDVAPGSVTENRVVLRLGRARQVEGEL
jgi:Cu-processing system permease protein